MVTKQKMRISLPVVITREQSWFVAACPLLDLATQGKSESEVRENMKECITDFFSDPDTQKPSQKEIASAAISVSSVQTDVVM